MDKSTDSISTVQMKNEYASSEIYSTASEAPPAYPMREASSVKIAKIIALTVVLASVIIGSFMLGSVYLQARATCDQMQALDSMLEKELLLETLQQELPKAESLIQSIDSNDTDDKMVVAASSSSSKSSSTTEEPNMNSVDHEFESEDAENDETADLNRVNVKMPLELNLSELAHSIMQSQQKSRMNCVIERRQAEELVEVDSYANNGEPRKRVTGERMAIFCESGSEVKEPERQAEQIPIVMMRPVGRFPIPYGAVPAHNPHTHMPMQMEPQQHQMPSSMPTQQQQPAQPQTQRLYPQQILIRQIHVPPQVQYQIQQQQQREQEQQQRAQEQQQRIQEQQQRMQEQRMHAEQHRFREQQQRIQAEQERIQSEQRMPQQSQQFNAPPPPFYAVRHNMPVTVQRMPEPNQMLTAPQREEPRPMINFQIREQQPHREMIPQGIVQSVGPHGVQLQRVPLSLALQRAGITPDDLRNIQRMAENRIQQEMQQLAADYSDASSGPSSSASSAPSSSSSSSSSSASSSFLPEDSSEESSDSEESNDSSQILQIGRSAFGRSVVTPIRIPVDLMQAIKQVESMNADAGKMSEDAPVHPDAPLQGPVRISPEAEGDETVVADNTSNNDESQH